MDAVWTRVDYHGLMSYLVDPSSVRMSKTSRTPACHTRWTPGVTLSRHSLNTHVYHRIPRYTLLAHFPCVLPPY
jgi:hypothetical protein